MITLVLVVGVLVCLVLVIDALLSFDYLDDEDQR